MVSTITEMQSNLNEELNKVENINFNNNVYNAEQLI